MPPKKKKGGKKKKKKEGQNHFFIVVSVDSKIRLVQTNRDLSVAEKLKSQSVH